MKIQSITILLFCCLLASCHTTRKASDHIIEQNTDSSKYWYDQYMGEVAMNDVLVKQMYQEEYAEFKFQKQPCPDTPWNNSKPNFYAGVQVHSDGAITASGPLESAKVFRKKAENLNQQHSENSKYSQTNERKEYYITKTIEHWHTETKKVKPSWWWNWLWFIAGCVAMYYGKPYIDKLKIFKV